MPRKRPTDQLERLVDCATRVFIAKGYKHTQMADVARVMGVAPGTLYLYVKSKEALFDLLVRYPFMNEEARKGLKIPALAPSNGETLEYLRKEFEACLHMPLFEAAMARNKADDAKKELEGILGEIYTSIEQYREGLALLEKSALEWPEMATLIHNEFRMGAILRFNEYMESRIKAKQFRKPPDSLAQARLVLETISWFAMHRSLNCCDHVAQGITDDVAFKTVVHTFVHAMVKDSA